MAEKITIKSAWGEEKRVLQRLDKMLAPHTFCEEDCLDIKTAVAEACLNAMEHGNGLQPELPVLIIVSLIDNTITVDVSDRGKGFEVFNRRADDSGRGWGMLFIQNMTNLLETTSDEKLQYFKRGLMYYATHLDETR